MATKSSKLANPQSSTAKELAVLAAELNRVLGKHEAKAYLRFPFVSRLSPEALEIYVDILEEEKRSQAFGYSLFRTDGLVARLQITVLRLDSTVEIVW